MAISFTGADGGISVTSNSVKAITIDTSNKVTTNTPYSGLTAETAAYRSKDIKKYNPNAVSGWYWLNLDGNLGQYWIDMEYDGGGWVLVASHPINLSIQQMPYLDCAQRRSYFGTNGSDTTITDKDDPHGFSLWLGLKAWDDITAQNSNDGGQKQCVYYTADRIRRLGEVSSHSRRSRWDWGGFSPSYAWRGIRNIRNEIGGTTPGLYSYHAANGYSFTTYDVDQDANSANCSTSYGNSGFWYGACWDGNFWGANGGSGHANAAFWTGSSGDYYNYGAIYVR